MLSALALTVFRFVVIVSLPFVVLVRGAVFLYEREDWTAWMALAGASVVALLVLSVYGAWVSRRVSGRARIGRVAKWVAAPLVIGYCSHALLFLSQVNAKTDEVRSLYQETHPLLRVALSTLILADRDAVITDLAREPDDYARMGLVENARSLHYPQADGWVHAVDLRTSGRPVRSWMVEQYFRAMGFETLRHTGTADHLHVQLAGRG